MKIRYEDFLDVVLSKKYGEYYDFNAANIRMTVKYGYTLVEMLRKFASKAGLRLPSVKKLEEELNDYSYFYMVNRKMAYKFYSNVTIAANRIMGNFEAAKYAELYYIPQMAKELEIEI